MEPNPQYPDQKPGDFWTDKADDESQWNTAINCTICGRRAPKINQDYISQPAVYDPYLERLRYGIVCSDQCREAYFQMGRAMNNRYFDHVNRRR